MQLLRKAPLQIRLRLLRGMIEPCYDSSPMHGLEILTLDNENNINTGTMFNYNSNPTNFPISSSVRFIVNVGSELGFLLVSLW